MAEIEFVLARIIPGDWVLELGCGTGRVMFSSYCERFWVDRFDWFRIQAKAGLIGEIDEKATGDGVIC